MKSSFYAVLAAWALCVAAPAMATQIPNGSLGYVNLTSPSVNYTVDPSSVAFNGATFEITGTGGFSSVVNKFGTMTGTVNFSATVNDTLSETLSNFFTFDDGQSGSYVFSVSSVQTKSYVNNPGSQSFSLYLLGTTLDTNLGYDPTATSLTLTFNQTSNSGFTASGTLAVPPESSVPEPASWAMMVGGFGLLGGALRRKRNAVTTTFA